VAYCAPEQLSGDEVSGRADQYALAATAYHLLTGEPLFPSEDPAEVIRDHLNSKPPTLAAKRPELAALDPVLTIGLAKRPESRFARCSDFARALTEQIGAMDAGSAPPTDGPDSPARDAFTSLYTEPLTVDPRAVAARPNQFPTGPIVAALVAAVVIAVLAIWLLWPSSGAPGADATPSSAAALPVNAEAQQKLLGALPPGYTSEACIPTDVPAAALAKLVCTRNADAGGPPAATFTLFRDESALDSAFGAAVANTRVVNCPGNIQSPGAWRRNATPQQVSGTLVCGFRDTVPTLAWTDEAKLTLNSVDGAQDGPNLDQLYVWWSSHS
jgi:hypothetical protein